jgi:hypothetical protein
MKPDFMLYTKSNELLLVVEVKAIRNEDEQWAVKLRRNLIAHGAVPESPFFLLVLPEHVYLWKDAPAEASPNVVSDTKHILRPYLSKFGEHALHLSESSLELAVRSWLNDIADPTRHKTATADENKLLEESGLATRMRHGAVLCGDLT